MARRGFRIVQALSNHFYLDYGAGEGLGDDPIGLKWLVRPLQKLVQGIYLLFVGKLDRGASGPQNVDPIVWPRAASSAEIFWSGKQPIGAALNVTEALPRLHWDKPWTKGVEPLSAHEIPQFLRHSSRIRKLKIQSEHPYLLSVIPAEACIFPGLKSLSLTTVYLDLFLPHMLHRCHLLDVDKGLQSFVTRCIALEHLCIYTPEWLLVDSIANQMSLLSDRIHWCTRLVTLCCPMLDWATWKHLSSLPTLLKLRIEQGCRDPPSLSKRDIVDLSILNITSLSFQEIYYVADIITVMQHSEFPSLKEFEFRAKYISPEDAEQLFHALSRCKACQTLEEITFCSLKETYFVTPNSEPLTPIPHFLCFTQLRTLELTFYNSCIHLDNDMLLQAMSTWPHIRTLEINDSGDYASSSKVSLRGLFTALRLCPELHTLRVSINLATIDIDPDAEPIQHTSLRSLALDLSESQTTDAETIARIISAWLPCVDQVTNIYGLSWVEVNRYLRSLRTATAPYVAGAS
ncbi:uncharacterized protein HD556DRAFT_1464209 [Suillus plorans]|uniref:Uncharacterized protein n=1 Tax=Suillus plorans TaxID=116603 RepID=A0A9P7D8S3_9AGAM|nr:uncharacterized protein HD556DRAFT_1464209 [Suillus plorans]KAG1784410.1 hypothetical protein HD556DRAFT_1464209 [Suillus plorans]